MTGLSRWDINVHKPTPQIRERAEQEEQQFLDREARETWNTIQDLRPQRGALGPEEVFSALWQRRVQELLTEPDVKRPGFRCSACGLLSLSPDACGGCGGKKAVVPDVLEESVHDAIEQSAHVRYWKDPVLNRANSLAALRRF